MKELKKQLERIDGKGYKAYKDIKGHYNFNDFTLAIDYVQGDPFASPSRIRIIVPRTKTIVEREWFESSVRRVRTEDWIAREVGGAIKKTEKHAKGTGKSGLLFIDQPGQKVIERVCCEPHRGSHYNLFINWITGSR